MKHVWMGFAALAFTLTSCSQDEASEIKQTNPDQIGFNLSTGKTRATEADLAALQGSAGIGIYATNGSPVAQFIDNKVYKYTAGTGWAWAVSDILWPTTTAGYPVNFYAYYPQGSATLTATLTKSYTIAATSALQADYLAANKLNVVTRPASSKVSLDFKHILSKIDFSVKSGAPLTATVQSIRIMNLSNTNTFNFASLTWPIPVSWSAAANYAYNEYGQSANNIFVGTPTETAVNVKGVSGSLMLLPQAPTIWSNPGSSLWSDVSLTTGAYIQVVYRIIETASGKNVVGYTNASDAAGYSGPATSLFVMVGYPLTANWKMSTAYNYVLHLGTASSSGGILIDKYFYDSNGNRTTMLVNDPGTGGPKLPGDPIFDTNKPIGFEVIVSPWGTVSSETIM